MLKLRKKYQELEKRVTNLEKSTRRKQIKSYKLQNDIQIKDECNVKEINKAKEQRFVNQGTKNNPYTYANEIMQDMEKRGFTQGQVERMVKELEKEIERNSEWKRQEVPFTIKKFT